MDATLDTSFVTLPLGWRMPSGEWRRLALRRPTRRDLLATRRIVDQVVPDTHSPAIHQLARSSLPILLRFFLCCPDLCFAVLAEDASGFRVRSSRDLSCVGELLLDGLDHRRRERKHNTQPAQESRRIAQRRERVHESVSQLVESLTEREDLEMVMAWRVAGDSYVNVDCSANMSPEGCRRRLLWFAQNVLGMQIDFRPESPMEWRVHLA